MMAGGQALEAYGAYRQGKLSRRLGKMKKQAAYKAAQQSVAAAQRQALEETRQAKLKASRAVAVAAAGGGSVDDPTVINLLEDIEQEGVYRAGVAMYEGESLAKQQRFQGRMDEFQGEVDYATGKMRMYGGFLKAGASLYGGQ